jgi:hypothetical protein
MRRLAISFAVVDKEAQAPHLTRDALIKCVYIDVTLGAFAPKSA